MNGGNSLTLNGYWAGGGAAGSIWIQASNLTGSGQILCIGGSGGSNGGGGAGT